MTNVRTMQRNSHLVRPPRDVRNDLADAQLAITHRADDEAFLLSIAATLPFLRGEQPFHENVEIPRLSKKEVRCPAGGTVVREVRSESSTVQLIVGDGWTANICWYARASYLSVSAESQAAIDGIKAEMQSWAPIEKREGKVGITFTYNSPDGPTRTWRSIEANPWSVAQRNYPEKAIAQLEALQQLTPSNKADGRIVLFHGPPGTGKSSLVRSLAESWSSWCDVEVVVDPEQLFSSSAYLFSSVLAHENDEGDSDDDSDDVGENIKPKRWRMFVLEDCGELLREDAKERNGQAMARLLNVADGVVGQGLRVLFCLTTNEDLRALHPALVRPGRCCFSVQIGCFNETEANTWLEQTWNRDMRTDPRPRVHSSRSLAELVAMCNNPELAIDVGRVASTGLYL